MAHRAETGTFVEIGGQVVDDCFRGRSISTMLVERIRERCTEKDVSVQRLHSNSKRTSAHRFYLNPGFAIAKEQKVFDVQLIQTQKAVN